MQWTLLNNVLDRDCFPHLILIHVYEFELYIHVGIIIKMAFKMFIVSKCISFTNILHNKINIIVGDSLTKGSNNMKFSTADQDNDNSTINCADTYKTAGWFKSCFTANINGLYSNNEKKYDYSYLTWGYSSSLKTFQMMIRPHA